MPKKEMSRGKRVRGFAIGTALAATITLAACGSGGSTGAGSTSAPAATSAVPAPVATATQSAGILGATQRVSDGHGDSLFVTYTFGPVQAGTGSSIDQGTLAGCPNVNDPSTAAVVQIQMQIRNTAKQAVIPSINFDSGEAVDLANNYSSGPECDELDAGPMSIQWNQLNPGGAAADTVWFIYPNVDYPLSDKAQLGQAASLVPLGWALNGNAARQGQVTGSRVSNCGPNNTAEGGALLYDFIPAGLIPAAGSIFCG